MTLENIRKEYLELVKTIKDKKELPPDGESVIY